ncbi:hypothetical protein RchiOBHm_Chr3g0470561 [Rosa chinensis]|uniref:Uncharacterized protein n=1 Tax=Rosa chinensis TaxID=74649 RepID=A0A2P6RB48_ROSCH|nr:hypothetical protein RchiOBHm_Chr3g0470561 [Rosa chinensis]
MNELHREWRWRWIARWLDLESWKQAFKVDDGGYDLHGSFFFFLSLLENAET